MFLGYNTHPILDVLTLLFKVPALLLWWMNYMPHLPKSVAALQKEFLKLQESN